MKKLKQLECNVCMNLTKWRNLNYFLLKLDIRLCCATLSRNKVSKKQERNLRKTLLFEVIWLLVCLYYYVNFFKWYEIKLG